MRQPHGVGVCGENAAQLPPAPAISTRITRSRWLSGSSGSDDDRSRKTRRHHHGGPTNTPTTGWLRRPLAASDLAASKSVACTMIGLMMNHPQKFKKKELEAAKSETARRAPLDVEMITFTETRATRRAFRLAPISQVTPAKATSVGEDPYRTAFLPTPFPLPFFWGAS